MDSRTEQEKMRDTALRSERRTIGHRMSRKVLVIAPTHRQAQEWAHEHGIAYSDAVVATPANWAHQVNGVPGIEHVILGWTCFDPSVREVIKDRLKVTGSMPFEGEPVDELCGTDPVRD